MSFLEKLRQKHEELQSGKSGGGGDDFLKKFLKVELGKNVIRILPNKDETKEFYAESMIHRYTDENGRMSNFHCRKIQNEACPLCDLHWDLWKMHKELNLPKGQKSKYGNLATKIRGTPRYYINVVDRRLLEADPQNPGAAVKIFSTGQQVFKKIVADIMDPEFQDEEDPANTTMLSLKRGNDFILELTKKGDFNNYDNSKTRAKKSPAGTDKEIAAFMESLHDIHGMIKIGEYEEGKKIADNLLVSLHSGNTPTKNSDEDSDGEDKFKESVTV